jgi:hypothetical protein
MGTQIAKNDRTSKDEWGNFKKNLGELSSDMLGRYKKAAGADASKADKAGDFERGNKRFKGINKATIKQFDNDSKKHKEQGVAEGLSEMDKSQTPPGRDGHVSHSTYGSRDKKDPDAGKKQYTAKGITAKQATTAATGILSKAFKDSQRVDPRTGKKMVQKGVAENAWDRLQREKQKSIVNLKGKK